jgi:hypothetical protein
MTAAPDPHLETDHRPEWLGGVVTLPSYITEGGKTYRPSMILWMDAATELILGTSAVAPEEALATIGANLRDTARSPHAGTALMPGRVRVASSELADALRRAGLDEVEVICAPTPELDRAIASLLEHFGGGEASDLRYLQTDVTAEGTAAMFRVAARLYKAKPWTVLPNDSCLIGVTSERLGLHDAAVSVIGQSGQVHGIVLFSSFEDFEQFADAADAKAHGEPAKFPSQLGLTYARRTEVGRELLEEIATHGWELANRTAYPVISVLDQDMVGRGPTRSEMLTIEALAASLAEILREHPAELEEAFEGGTPLVLRKQLATSDGDIALEISMPHPRQRGDHEPSDDDELDDDRLEAACAEILRRFQASPEAQAEPEAHWANLLVDYAASYFDTTVESLSAVELREILFEIFPRKVSVEPEAAPAIIAGFRAFLTFLQRERPDPRAAARLAVLDGNASQRLARALADRSNFGPAKAFMMSGLAAGFDMSSEAGIAAWGTHTRKNDVRLPMGLGAGPAARRATPAKQRAQQQAKKAKRKTQRAARNKNRSR